MGVQRLSKDERRRDILRAALPLFARKGLHGVKTKELAAEAGVSEALLFQHFPTKESLYQAIQEGVFAPEADDPQTIAFMRAAPSTAKLVWAVHEMIRHIALQRNPLHVRIIVQSLLADGKFAKAWFKGARQRWFAAYQREFEAAREAGDLKRPRGGDEVAFWLTQHVAFALLLFVLPGYSAIEYGKPREEVIRLATRFCLRGIGLKDEVIERLYDSGAYEKALG